ncbi:hypothetical protein V8F33_013083 [Rhypophila sp. PSN 637]
MDHYSSPSVFNISGTWQGTHASGSAQVHQGPQINVYQHGGLMKVLYSSKYERGKNRNQIRTPGTCKWVLNHEKFVRWRDSSSASALWVSANAGSGKSVLSRALVDESLVCSHFPVDLPPVVCYFFFKDDDASQNTGEAALCALLHQLLSARGSTLRHDFPQFHRKQEALRDSLTDLRAILETIAQDPATGSVICILDALDECEETSRNDLIERILRFITCGTGRSTRVKFLLTSRPYPEVETYFEGAWAIRISAEIKLSIQQQVTEIFASRQYRPSDATQRRIIDTLQDKGNLTYLWHQREARILFQVVLVAKRPLSLREMDIALAIADGKLKPGGSHSGMKLKGNEGLEEYIKTISGSLISIVKGNIYLLHQTAREVLMARENAALAYHDDKRLKAHHSSWEGSFDPKESHYLLSGICMTYLLVDELNKEAETTRREEDIYERVRSSWGATQYTLWERQFPFLWYSRTHWHWHYQHCQDDSDTLVALGEQLCQVGRTIRFQVISDDRRQLTFPKESPAQLTPLEVALRYEVPLLVEAMIRRGAITSPEFLAEVTEDTIVLKSVSMVKILVTNMTPEHLYKSLEFACVGGNEKMVRYLIETGLVKPDSDCLQYQRIEVMASAEEWVSILKLLLAGGADETLLDEASQGQIRLFLAMDSRDLETASPFIMEWVHSNLSSEDKRHVFSFIIEFGDSIWGETDRWVGIRRQIESVFHSIYGCSIDEWSESDSDSEYSEDES